MAFDFRLATVDEVDQIASIEMESMPNPWKADSYIEAINSDHAFVMVAMDDKRVAGYAVFYLTPPEAELPDIVVDLEYRGKGLGRSLLTEAFAALSKNSIDTVFLEVRESNAAARSLYNSLGFEEIGKRKYFYSNPVEDAICMSLHM
ncbi:MAG: ribosomal protein S18-alanine N-acetyltransferase [Pseudobutyrivibrio sp.]|nr:ribosomal protein S18-alanine N-acetyltransferase [Pseudobutyrivibrio sp.]